jgi:hypothetical protein
MTNGKKIFIFVVVFVAGCFASFIAGRVIQERASSSAITELSRRFTGVIVRYKSLEISAKNIERIASDIHRSNTELRKLIANREREISKLRELIKGTDGAIGKIESGVGSIEERIIRMLDTVRGIEDLLKDY